MAKVPKPTDPMQYREGKDKGKVGYLARKSTPLYGIWALARLKRSKFGMWTLELDFHDGHYNDDIIHKENILVGPSVIDNLKEIGIPVYVEGEE